MEATGYAYDLCTEKNVYNVNMDYVKWERQRGNTLILGIGTGVGVSVSFKYSDHKLSSSMSSEFSQSSMCVKNIFDFRFQEAKRQVLNMKPKNFVTIEHVISAYDLPFLYAFM